MKIIAALDFSAASMNAARCAVRLARKVGDTVVLARVIEPPILAYPELPAPDLNSFEASIQQGNRDLLDKAVSELGDAGVVVESQLRSGRPAAELAKLAAIEKARLIVMGNHGHTALGNLFLGSVAERTVLSAPCPVLLVPEGRALFEGWDTDHPLRVLAGYQLDSSGDAVMASLSDLRRAGPCEATVVHTYWPPAEYARLGSSDRKDLFATDPQVAAVLEREIRARVARHELPHDLNLEIEAAWGPVQDTLNLDAREAKADLLIVGTRQPHGWQRLTGGSTALGTVRRSTTAVLCVPARTAPPARSAVPPLRTILVATDFSELANAAIPYAYSLLRGAGGTVELCHVREPDRLTTVPGYGPLRKLSAQERAEIEARLRALIPPEAERLDITTGLSVVEEGSAAEAILQTSRRIGADAITLGSHGRSGVARTLLGSVAEGVLRGSDRPVFIVRPPAR